MGDSSVGCCCRVVSATQTEYVFITAVDGRDTFEIGRQEVAVVDGREIKGLFQRGQFDHGDVGDGGSSAHEKGEFVTLAGKRLQLVDVGDTVGYFLEDVSVFIHEIELQLLAVATYVVSAHPVQDFVLVVRIEGLLADTVIPEICQTAHAEFVGFNAG